MPEEEQYWLGEAFDGVLRGRAVTRTKKNESWLELQFNIVLHHLGKDWAVYKNEWDARIQEIKGTVEIVPSRTLEERSKRQVDIEMRRRYMPSRADRYGGGLELLYRLVEGLMADGTGVEKIVVTPYTIKVFKSAAVPDSVIIDMVNELGRELNIC